MQALFDLEATNSELKPLLRDLYITSAREIEIGSSRKAIVVNVCNPSDSRLLLLTLACEPQRMRGHAHRV